MTISRQEQIHATAVAKGFWDGEADINFILAKLCLVHSEVSEMMEAIRKEQGTYKILEEAADIVIRLEDLIQGMYDTGWLINNDLDAHIAEKMGVNKSRPKLHGNLV